MTMRFSRSAYDVEISDYPSMVHFQRGADHDEGLSFSDFSFEQAGFGSHSVSGLQLGVARTAPGVSLSFRGDHRAQSFTSDVFLMRGLGQRGDADWSGGYRAKFLSVAPNVLERVLRTPLSQISIDPLVCDLSERRDVYHLLSALSGPRGGHASEDVLLLESVTVAVLRAIGVRSRDRVRKAPTLSQSQADVMYEVIRIGLTRSLSLTEMADAVGLSESYFVRAFKGSFGVSPYQYVLRERVALAQSLIRSGQLSLKEIAALSGFADANRMSRTFRQVTGRGPTGMVKARRRRAE